MSAGAGIWRGWHVEEAELLDDRELIYTQSIQLSAITQRHKQKEKVGCDIENKIDAHVITKQMASKESIVPPNPHPLLRFLKFLWSLHFILE